MKRRDGIVRLPTGNSLLDKTLLYTTVYAIIGISSLVNAYPSWDSPTSITDFGRNIRQLPCVSRRTGETGVCMFAYSCAKVNGTHLGTCIDRFYFGSCCKTLAELDVGEPDNYLNSVDNEVAGGPQHQQHAAAGGSKIGTSSPPTPSTSATDRYNGGGSRPSAAAATTYQPSSSYKPTAQFAVHSSTPVPAAASSVPSANTTTTSRTQYAETSTAKQPASTSVVGAVTSSYASAVAQSTRPAVTSAAVKPSSTAAPAKTKPQSSAKPTVQFSVPGGPNASPSTKPTSTYTTVTSMRPLNASAVTATFSTTKPVLRPSSTTYKSTSASLPPQQQLVAGAATTASTPQKAKPQQTIVKQPASTTSKPKPPPSTAAGRPTDHASPSTAAAPPSSTAAGAYATRTTVENVTESTAVQRVTAAMISSSSSSSSPATPVTSTLPSLVTWTTLDKVPATPSESAASKPPPSLPSYRPTGADGPTTPSWVKLPVFETHEPPAKEPAASSTADHAYGGPSTTAPSPSDNGGQSPSDNDIFTTSNGFGTNAPGTLFPSSSTLSSILTSILTPPSLPPSATPTAVTATDSNEAADVPLNMSNYKDVCGRRLFPTARIVGGEKVSFGKWPWQISLRQWRTSTYLHKCGAALFNENWAVTAAHCVENVPPSDLLLRLGEHDLSDEEEPYGYEERRIQIVASHPNFDPRTFEYDLALLRFYEPVKFQPNIIPVCVPDDDSSYVGSSAYVTGWGRLYEDGPLPSILQEVTVPVINNSVCETMYRSAGYIEHIPNIFICAGWKKGGFDSCEGDSGGPMVIQRPDKRWMLAGIISWGIGCAEPNQPGVYTRISKFRDWINHILEY